MDSASIFDLAPPRSSNLSKIFGTTLRPRRMPCQSTIGKSRNSRAGKRIYWKTRLRGCPGKRSSAGCVPAMPVELVIAPEAELDIAGAYIW